MRTARNGRVPERRRLRATAISGFNSGVSSATDSLYFAGGERRRSR